jgi:hypothetical protein
VYFDPEEIVLDRRIHQFIDGGITPYNNPSLIAGLTAVLPCYNMDWEPGPDKIRIVSLGTMRFSTDLSDKAQRLWLGYHAAKIPAALMRGVGWQQDYLCRCLGECLYAEHLDSEIGDLVGIPLPGRSWFSYVRYDKTFEPEVLRAHPNLAKLDAIKAIPELRELGKVYANKCVKLEHLI